MPSPTDFNLSPYYDDFNESKKFHRILFRPSFAVQARELTQSQSILQNQVEKVSDHLFKQGAMVIPGQVSIDTEYTSIKLTSKSAASLSTYNSTTLTGNTSGVVAEVVGVSVTDGTDPDTLFIKYNKAGTNNTSLVFTDGETVTSNATGSPTLVVATTHTGSASGIQEGVYYINGFHVKVDSSTLVLDKYTNTPSYRIGLTVTESFETPNDDTTLNDNAQGTSNVNAPGAHRFKITLTLAKKTLTAVDDNNFYEIARVENGIIKSMVRTTEYAVLEDTLARRTFDESGDYVLQNPDFDVREHLVSGNNRGIYTASSTPVGSATKLALGVSPFKAYVNGYESERLGTTFVDVNKARDFDTANNNKTRFTLDNYFNVNNVYNTPDVGFVSGAVEAFKTVNLFDTATAVRGTQQTTVGTTVPQIGRAKSRGFEYVTGSETNDIFATSGIYRHYLFDIEMFTHLNVLEATSFTTGEIVSGASSGATGVVQSISATKSAAASSISVANPGVVTLNAHGFKDGQQIVLSGGNFQIDSGAYTPGTFTVRNATTNTFELFGADGTTAQDVTAFTSGPTMTHGVVVLSNVKGTFAINETITGQTSNNSATIQPDRLGLGGVSSRDISAVKQIGMAGSPTYTSDTDLTSTYATNETITGNISIANSSTSLLGKGTNFTVDLKAGDSITFTNNAGATVTAIIKNVVSQTQATLSSAVGGSDVSTAAVVTRRRAKLTNPENNILLFKLPYSTVKTLKTTTNSGATDTNFNVRRQFKGDLSSNGDITISAGSNETFASLANNDFTVSIMSTGSGGTGAVGDVLNLSGSNHEGDSIFNLTGSPTGKTLNLDFGANFATHTVKILATVSRTIAGSKTKTLNSGSTVTITSQSSIESGIVGLGKADIFKINNIYMSSGFGATPSASDTDITSRFELDNGQRDNFYDIGRIKLKPGAIVPTGQLLVNFDFFSHGAGEDYFDVDSYSGVIDYENIPSYTSDTTGTKFELRDVLDFRPRVDDASTIDSGSNDRSFDGTGASTIDIPEFGSDITSDLEFYLSRVDKVFLTREGNLRVVEGASDLNPLEPSNLDGHMLLATLNIPAYTLQTDDVVVDAEDNRRYTMRDIGNLETRIKNIEYYTQLSLLEADAQGLQIQDSNGFDRFKNGFVVDNFTGHNVGDVGNNDYKLSIDRARGEARTLFNEDVVELSEADDDGTSILSGDRTDANYQKTGDIITLPYSETNYIEQPFATKTENLNPFLVFNWVGDIELDPPVDEWKETRRAPEIVVNVNGTFDNMAINRGLDNTSISEIPVGTEWNEWQDQWSGNPRTTRRWQGNQLVETTNRDVTQVRAGVRTTIVPQTLRQSLGNRVISVAFVPFIRSRTIGFEGYGLRPNTRVYPYFDNIDVSTYVTPTGGSLGGNVTTDANGFVSGTFAIPNPNTTSNPRWRTGKRVFRLTSSSTNSADRTAVATSAEGDYDAKGLLETTQEAIISSREARTVRTATTGNRTQTRTSNRVVAVRQPPDNGGGGRENDGGRGDPLAQSFIVDEEDGIFITSLDAFFATKSSTIPVKAEIRNMVNGYPGPKVLPFATKWLNPSSVNVSTDATTATTFTFDSPVYLQEGIEYCIVLYSDSVDYTAYVARLGETQIGSNRTVSAQPNIGVLFKSANNRSWTAEQMEDMKFTLKKAVFDTSSTGTLTLTNATLPVKTLDANPIRTFNGSGIVRVFHKNHGMHSTNNSVTISGFPSGTTNGIDTSVNAVNKTYTAISNITLDSYDVDTGGTANATGDVGGSSITATQNRMFDLLQLQIGNVTHPLTSINATLRTTTGKSIHGSESPFALQGTTSAKNVVLGDNLYFTVPRMVASEVNETALMAGSKSMFVNLTISSSNANLSPVIDLKRVNAFAISNRLNQPSVSNTDTFTGDGSTTAFTMSASPSSVHLVSVKKSGKKLSPVDDFTVSGTTLTLTTAPASGSKIVAKLSNMVDYEDDTAIEGGSSEGSYITRPVTLENPSTAIDVRVAASIRSTSSIKMFFRLSGGEETRRIQDIEFTPFNVDGSSDTNITPSQGDEVIDLDFKDYKFSASALPEFTSFQIKVIFNGTNSAYPARLKDFRALALAV